MADQPYSGAEIQDAIKILREDAVLAHQRTVVQRLDAMDQRLNRMPVAEMTAEEKAAAYDKLMAGQTPPGAGPGAPPAGAPPAPGAGTPPGAPPSAGGNPPPPPARGERRPSAAEDQEARSWWSIYQKESGQS